MSNQFSPSLIAAVLESTDNHIFAVDLDFRLTYCNHAFIQSFTAVYGYAPEIGKVFEELLPPHRRGRFSAYFQQALVQSSFHVEHTLTDGRILEITFSAVVDKDKIIGITAFGKDISKRKMFEAKLRESELRFRTTFEQAAVGFVQTSLDGRYIHSNQRFAEILGYRQEDIPSLSIQQVTYPPDLPNNLEELRRLGEGTALNNTWQKRYVRKDGSLTWVRGTSSVQRDDSGNPIYLFSVVEDINAIKKAEEKLHQSQLALEESESRYRDAYQTSETLYRIVLKTSVDCITISNLTDGLYIEANKATLDLFGYDYNEFVGHTSAELNIWVNPEDRISIVDAIRHDMPCRNLKRCLRKKNGETFWASISFSLIQVNGTDCIIGITRDISEFKEAESTIHNLAFYDTLTHLPNRRLLLDRLKAIAESRAIGSHLCALLYVDIDHFKLLNDNLGHEVGDLLLQEVASRLTACVRNTDVVARLGSDEFAVIVEDISNSANNAVTRVKVLAAKILSSLSKPFTLGSHECRISASIGITLFGDHPDRVSGILGQADLAISKAKISGRNSIQFFTPDLQQAITTRVGMEEDLHRAIQHHEFTLFYQPQVEQNLLTGAECLIRWKHPTRGLLGPENFIPFAEESGLILPIADWVLETACRQIVAWSKHPHTAHLSLAVNISARQFRERDFVQHILSIIQASGADPDRVRLEITESFLLDNLEDVIEKMAQLKARHLRFSLDDFGTGYSSLSYLKRLPLDRLKIDRAFITDILEDSTSAAIAQSIISLGRAMHLPVIAEGVESDAQRDFLTNLGCHSFQGYLFGMPMPIADFEKIIPPTPTIAFSPATTVIR